MVVVMPPRHAEWRKQHFRLNSNDNSHVPHVQYCVGPGGFSDGWL